MLFPLPQPRLQGAVSNEWLVSLELDADHERVVPLIPLGLVISRLAPASARPMAQLMALWLRYRVLPVCARCGGPTTWAALDQMLNPIPQT